jgi:hypothetical protein
MTAATVNAMNEERIGPDRLRVPRRADGPNGEIGDGMVEIGPDDPEYDAWVAWIDRGKTPTS